MLVRKENEPIRTVLFFYGATGIGKSLLYKSIIKGKLADFNISMNPKDFNGTAKDKSMSASDYHLFVNEEAAVKKESKLCWDQLKKLWEGK